MSSFLLNSYSSSRIHSIQSSELSDVERLLPIVHSTNPEFQLSSLKLFLPVSIKQVLSGKAVKPQWRQEQIHHQAKDIESNAKCYFREATGIRRVKTIEKQSFSFITTIGDIGRRC